jgi:conjugal transfer pilus assembly protein TraW
VSAAVRRIGFPLCATALAAVLAGDVHARDYGQHGAVWPVIEPDLMAQIHAKLLHLQATGEIARLNVDLERRTIAKVNRPEPVAGIAHASVLCRWTFDPTIVVDADIADDKGRVIIARGTRVNPLDTVPLRGPLVFLDGDDQRQIDWALTRYARLPAKFILTGGAPLELMKARQRRFYFDQGGKLLAHFAIHAVPAVVEQQGRQLVVTEQPSARPS